MDGWFMKGKRFVRRTVLFLLKRFARFIPGRLYLSAVYYVLLGRRLHLDDPKTFTEKLQWLKLYYYRPESTEMVDKHLAKKWIADRIGEDYIVPTLGVWERFEDIDFDSLPDRFVLKCNHDNGSVVVCKDKSQFDIHAAKEKLNRCMRRDFYAQTREWPYKNVSRRIIAETYLDDGSGDLKDYKFLCFDGVPRVMYVVGNRSVGLTTDYYDMDFHFLPIVSRDGGPSGISREKPALFEEMKRIASILSAGFPHLRVDFYCVRDHLYCGELTFFVSSGYDDLFSLEWDRKFGDWLTLPPKNVGK